MDTGTDTTRVHGTGAESDTSSCVSLRLAGPRVLAGTCMFHIADGDAKRSLGGGMM